LDNKHKLSKQLCEEIKKIIRFDNLRTKEDVQKFQDKLPYHLRMQLVMEIHQELHQNIKFFKDKSDAFIAYIAPLLLESHFNKDQFIYNVGEHINFIYFIIKGEAGFVLPRYDNAIYILIGQGDHFGQIDMLPYKEQNGKLVRVTEKNFEKKRQFTVQALSFVELMCLKIEDLSRIELEFQENYAEFFMSSLQRYK
jgi:CRP-like cAMP-binding protein